MPEIIDGLRHLLSEWGGDSAVAEFEEWLARDRAEVWDAGVRHWAALDEDQPDQALLDTENPYRAGRISMDRSTDHG